MILSCLDSFMSTIGRKLKFPDLTLDANKKEGERQRKVFNVDTILL